MALFEDFLKALNPTMEEVFMVALSMITRAVGIYFIRYMWKSSRTRKRIENKQRSCKESIAKFEEYDHNNKAAETNEDLNFMMEPVTEALQTDNLCDQNKKSKKRPLHGIPVSLEVNCDMKQTAKLCDQNKKSKKRRLYGTPVEENCDMKVDESKGDMSLLKGKLAREYGARGKWLRIPGAVPFVRTNISKATMTMYPQPALIGPQTSTVSQCSGQPALSKWEPGQTKQLEGTMVPIETDVRGDPEKEDFREVQVEESDRPSTDEYNVDDPLLLLNSEKEFGKEKGKALAKGLTRIKSSKRKTSNKKVETDSDKVRLQKKLEEEMKNKRDEIGKKTCKIDLRSVTDKSEMQSPMRNITKIDDSNTSTIISISDTEPNTQTQDSHWITYDEISLTHDHKTKILNGSELDDKVIDFSQAIIKKQFGIDGFQSTLFFYKQFGPVLYKFVQILFQGHNDNGHWVTVSNMFGCEKNEVKLYDSLNPTTIHGDIRRQVCSILKSRLKNVNIIRYDLEKQHGERDCGVYAIAYAVSVSQGDKPETLKFDQNSMRDHLIDCLKNKEFTVFPSAPLQSENMTCPIVKIDVFCCKIDVFCYCRLPHDDSNPTMIVCSKCDERFHVGCVSENSRKKKLNSSNDKCYNCDNCKQL